MEIGPKGPVGARRPRYVTFEGVKAIAVFLWIILNKIIMYVVHTSTNKAYIILFLQSQLILINFYIRINFY